MDFFVFVSGATNIPILDLVLILGLSIVGMALEVSDELVRLWDLLVDNQSRGVHLYSIWVLTQ